MEWRAVEAAGGSALRLLTRLGIRLTRSGDSFVSYTVKGGLSSEGGTLNIAPPDELDEDDSVAQIVVHELMHWCVEGEDASSRDDWGLDNISDDHLAREYAALRLQYAWLAEHRLERALFPTTDHRWFYEALVALGSPWASVHVAPGSEAKTRGAAGQASLAPARLAYARREAWSAFARVDRFFASALDHA